MTDDRKVEFAPAEGSGVDFDADPKLEGCGDSSGWRSFGTWDWNKVAMGAGAAAALAGAAYAARKLTAGREGNTGADDFQLRLETDETMRLISSRKVEGTAVYGADGARLGTIESFMVDKYTGRVAYAVMSFGGHFGFGSSHFPLPWPVLDYDEEMDGYVLNITKDELAEAPRFDAHSEPEFDVGYRRRVLIFYRPSADDPGKRQGSGQTE